MGAAGRDFHNFNVVYRHDPCVEVIAFTAAQIPQISDRRYPPPLSGPLYPDGIPIVAETELTDYCLRNRVQQVIFAYSDLPHEAVMHKASAALCAGCDFILLGPEKTMVTAKVPVIAVSAVRTGCGKSQTSRFIAQLLASRGIKVAAIRHPMPYGELRRQIAQRFSSEDDLSNADCTIEEREEYEPYIQQGITVFAGSDYQQIVEQAELEAEVIIWDGGNNDFPFIRPDLHLVLVDPLRPGDETTHHPGETVLRQADCVIVAKVNVAADADVQEVINSAQRINPEATIIKAGSRLTIEKAAMVKGKRVLVIEDGPTTTHGGMSYGAGYIAALEAGVREIIDPRPAATGVMREVFEAYPHLSRIVPAVGYYPDQLASLTELINNCDAELVVSATPCNLAELIQVDKPMVRVGYEFSDDYHPSLSEIVNRFTAGISAASIQQ